MDEKKNEIDTGIGHYVKPHLRPRPEYWPADCFCREYFSSVLPKFYQAEASWESKATPWVRRWLKENDMLLKEQREEISPIVSKTNEDRRRAAQDAQDDIHEFNQQGRIDRRDAAVETGDCSAEYVGRCKDLGYGQGTGKECFRCAGQVVKLKDSNKLAAKHTASGGARQARQRGGD